MTLIDTVAAAFRGRIQSAPGARVLAAVSGGADSVALARVLADLSTRGLITLAGIGHLNHQLRGADADADEAFVGALAARLAVPFLSSRADVKGLAAERGESLEAAARRARYAWLAQAAAQVNAAYIATGHTLEDQAETVLLRALRGAGNRGLSGIRVVHGAVIRPMLDCHRQDVRTFLAEHQQEFREDASNADLSIARNRVRHELLPVIDRIAPGGCDALARTAALAHDDELFLSKTAIDTARSLVLSVASGVQVQRAALAALAPAIARRVIRIAIEQASDAAAPWLTSRHLEAVWRLALNGQLGSIDVPSVRISCGETMWFEARRAETTDVEVKMAVPGAVTVLELGWKFSAERCDQSVFSGVEAGERSREALRIAVPAEFVEAGVVIRNRRSGDRIKPIGAPGRKKLQDLMVDRKIPRRERVKVPVVVNASGQILWVVGVAMADAFRVTAPEREVVVFTAERQ